MSAPDTPGAQPPLPRRGFLDWLLGFGFVSTALSALYPVMRYMVPPASAEPAVDTVVAGKATEFAPNSGAVIKFGSQPAIVLRTPDGELRAFTAVCTHLSCTVQYKSDTSQIWCACHNGYYDLSGNVVSGPPPRPLESFKVNLRGDPGQEDVVISRS